jgi:RNA polymerase sigma-70 factor (ECF subfamily)
MGVPGSSAAAHRSTIGAVPSWEELVEAANCASLLVVIESRLGAAMRARIQPEDILQDSLLQAWRDRESVRFDSPRAFRSWLLTIIDHRIRDTADHLSARKRGGLAASPGASLGPEPGGSTTPSRIATQKEQAAMMSEALNAVPPEWRDVVCLRLFHQLTLQQVAEQLSLSLAVVRTRLRRGSEVYRQRLRAAGIGRSTLISAAPRAFDGADPASQR